VHQAYTKTYAHEWAEKGYNSILLLQAVTMSKIPFVYDSKLQGEL